MKQTAWIMAAGMTAALGWLGAPAAPAADDPERIAAEKWIETRHLISQERQDWRLGKELLTDRARVLENELKAMQAKTGTVNNATSDVDRKFAEAQARNDQLRAAQARNPLCRRPPHKNPADPTSIPPHAIAMKYPG